MLGARQKKLDCCTGENSRFALSGQFRIVEGAFAHRRNFGARLAEITRAGPAMGRGIDTHSLRTDGSLAIACPEFHDPAGEVSHPLFGRAAFGALGIHGPIIVASSRCLRRPCGQRANCFFPGGEAVAGRTSGGQPRGGPWLAGQGPRARHFPRPPRPVANAATTIAALSFTRFHRRRRRV